MTFPGDKLKLKTELLIGGTWTDISSYVYTRDPVTITRGRPDEASSVNPSALGLTLNNRDGRFSPRNPLGPWYGQFGRNTQIRVSAPTDATQATLAYRFWGEIPELPPRWDVSGRDVYVLLTAAGLLRRLNQNTNTAGSALRRAWLRVTGLAAPVAYWPCEDGTGATQFASGLSGGAAMSISGSPQLSSDSSFACSDALPVIAKSTWRGNVPTASLNAPAVRFPLHVQSEPADQAVLVSLPMTGGSYIARVDLLYHTGGGLRMIGYDGTGAVLFDTGNQAFGLVGTPAMVSLEFAFNTSSNLQYTINVLPAGASSVTSYTNNVGALGSSATPIAQVVVSPNADIDQVGLGQITVQPYTDALSGYANPLAAWAGETAGARFTRLCSEEGITGTLTGTAGTLMGAQGDARFVDLLQEIEDADRGLLFEPRDSFGLGYIGIDALYNQSPAVTLDYAAAQLSPPLEPTDDDQLLRNDVTVDRKTVTGSGSNAEATVTTGALSTASPPAGVGTYGYALSANVEADTQLADVAGWIAHVGTVDEPRYPVLTVEMAAAAVASVFNAVQSADIGSYVAVANPPSWLPPGDIKQLVYGVTETLNAKRWTVAWNCVPESPYEVAQAGSTRADTTGSTLAAGVTASATSLSVATTDTTTPLWTTLAADFPFDILVGGERMTVTAITGATSPQAFTVTRSVNGVVKSHLSGEAVTLALTPVAAL